MHLYLRVTGGGDLKNFWKLSPAELLEWVEAKTGSGTADGFEDVEIGEEVLD